MTFHPKNKTDCQRQSRRREMLLKLAVKYLCHKLKKDRNFWYSYQSNIAMSIYDNLQKYLPLTTAKKSPTLMELSNICANDFMKLWTGKT